MKTRKRVVFGLLLLGCVVGVLCCVYFWPMLTREAIGPPKGALPDSIEGGNDPVSGQWVGHVETDVVERFGPPSHRWSGHYAAPPVEYKRRYPDAVTLTYIRPAGILYLSFCRENGRLVCFSSDWLPEGWVF